MKIIKTFIIPLEFFSNYLIPVLYHLVIIKQTMNWIMNTELENG